MFNENIYILKIDHNSLKKKSKHVIYLQTSKIESSKLINTFSLCLSLGKHTIKRILLLPPKVEYLVIQFAHVDDGRFL